MISNETALTPPKHLGLIIDGNRRWAKEHNLSINEGHKRGYENLKNIVKAANREGIHYVSAFIFSTENWSREKTEVRDLMKLCLWIMKHELKVLHKEGVRIRVIGSKLKLGKSLIKAIHNAEVVTKDNERGTLLLCLDYGGQQEIVEATKRIVKAGYNPDDITPDLLSRFLYAPDVPPIDLIIRTSGEKRLSNFMLWESAYSELLFTKVYWPDFSKDDLHAAIKDYSNRKRRFGS